MSEFGKGIPLASGFDLGAKIPLDSRIIVETLADRDAHVTGNRAYEGMKVYVKENKKNYQYIDEEWREDDINLDEYITETELEEKGYLTEHQDISGKADKTELHEHSNKTVLDIITEQMVSDWNNKSEFSGNYNDLINKPNIPSIEGLATEDYVDNAIKDIPEVDLSGYATKDELPIKTSDLTNDSNFVNEEYVDNKVIETTDSLEKIVSSNTIPTDKNVAIWINTSEDTASNPLARVSDDIVSNEHTWSSEKIYQYITDLLEKYNDLLEKYNDLNSLLEDNGVIENCLQDIDGNRLQDIEGNYLIFKESA